MKRRLIIVIMLALLLTTLYGCVGPDPVVTGYTWTPPSGQDQPLKVDVVVTNQRATSGQVEVVVNVRDKQSGQTLAQDANDIDLGDSQVMHVNFAITLPDAAQNIDPNNIQLDIEAKYPIE